MVINALEVKFLFGNRYLQVEKKEGIKGYVLKIDVYNELMRFLKIRFAPNIFFIPDVGYWHWPFANFFFGVLISTSNVNLKCMR